MSPLASWGDMSGECGKGPGQAIVADYTWEPPTQLLTAPLLGGWPGGIQDSVRGLVPPGTHSPHSPQDCGPPFTPDSPSHNWRRRLCLIDQGRTLSSKGMYCFIILFLPESKKKKQFYTSILLTSSKMFPTLNVAFSVCMREETRPRPLVTEQVSLCSSPSGLLNLPSRTVS